LNGPSSVRPVTGPSAADHRSARGARREAETLDSEFVLAFGVLGPLAVWREGEPVELLGARQRFLLARLLTARGRVVGVDRLIDDLWGSDQPGQPTAAIQAFVSRLRRQLEPDREPRSSASVLATVAPGYALRAEADQVDAERFERLVRSAFAVSEAEPNAAFEQLTDALSLWRGDAYAEFPEHGWARAEAERLDKLRLEADEYRADAGLRSGRAAAVATTLASYVAEHPLRERGWALLAAAQYATGDQASALTTLRRARTVLADELGVDPGPALRKLEGDILAQADHLVRLPPPTVTVAPTAEADLWVGRGSELGRLVALADRGGLVQLLGEAGAGKTAMLDHLAAELANRGWLIGRGRCAETGGVLPGWPWAEAVRALAVAVPPAPATAEALAWLLQDDIPSDTDPVVGQHRTRRAMHSYFGKLASRGRLMIALDDVHRADPETLAVLASVCAALAGSGVLIVVSRRASEGSTQLDDVLAQLARHEPERIALRGLDPEAVAAIVAQTAGARLDAPTIRALTERTGGNPFFVRETARLVAEVGPEAALAQVPAGVQDILGRRIAQLASPARAVLVAAAVLGRDIGLDVLMAMTGETEDVVLDAIEWVLIAGLLTEPGPGRLAFPHALVRDAAYETVSRMRRARLHVRAAAALEQQRPRDVTAIAHHYETAGDAAPPAQTLRFARLAAAEAEQRYAFTEAARWWRVALTATEAAGGSAADRLLLLIAEVRAIASSGDLVSARELRAETMQLADAIDDAELAVAAIASFDVPTIWTNRPYGSVDAAVVDRSERVLRRLPTGDSEPRCRMLVNLALELEGEGQERGFAAAREAEGMARRLGHPQLVLMALNAVLLEQYWPGGHAERQRVGRDLLDLGAAEHLVPATVLGHMALAQTSAAQGAMASADEHIATVMALAESYEQPLTAAIASWYAGLHEVVAGRLDAALDAYAQATARMARLRMWAGEGDTVTATIACAWLSVGRMGEIADRWDQDSLDARRYPELYALALASAGRIDEARRAAGPPTPIRRDYAYDLNWGVRGLLGVAIDDADRADAAYKALSPFPHLLAAAGSAVLVVRPVSEILGDIAASRHDQAAATQHYETALTVAERAGAQHWAARCQALL
jgi:DNA-binding SARP family transcriptional activator